MTHLLTGRKLESLNLGGQMMNMAYWKAIVFFMTGHALVWFQLNSHTVFDSWKGFLEYQLALCFYLAGQ